jgi:hypothetical protein
MNKSKLIELYNTLDKVEHRTFKKWLLSPLHNEHKEVQQLFHFIGSRYKLNSTTLNKERVWKQLYPSQTYNDLRLRHLMSISLDILKNFVRYFSLKEDYFQQEKVLAKRYSSKKINKSAHQQLKKAAVTLDKLPWDEQYYYHQYELEALTFELEGTQKRTRTTNISEITTNARLFFMLTTLRYAYTALTHQNLLKTDYNFPLLEHILSEIKLNDYSEHPLLMIYYHAYYTLKTPENDAHFLELKGYLSHSNIGIKNQRHVLLIALNYAIKRTNTGSKNYMRDALELYQIGLENHLLMEDTILSHFAYKNIVSATLVLEEYDWGEQFIKDYTSYLMPEHQTNYAHYNRARILLARGDLDQAMSLLIEAEYDDPLLLVGAKVELLKLYYQREYWDTLEAFLESFRIFLNRKKALSYHKQHYVNLILFVKKLVAINLSIEMEVKGLEIQIRDCPKLAQRAWALEQVKLLQ